MVDSILSWTCIDIIIPVMKMINPGKGLYEKDCCGGGNVAEST
jgi:hypothetical protein